MPDQPPAEAWLTLEQAAQRLGRTEATLARWAQSGRLDGRRGSHGQGTLWLVTSTSVDKAAAELDAWISTDEAAQLVGCSRPTIQRAVDAGRITRRDGARAFPSLERRSVQEFATWWRQHLDDVDRARQARTAARDQPREDDPPGDGSVWLSVPEVAALLRLTRNRVLALVHEERIPATRRGRRWWIRRDHAEQVAAARALHTRHRRP